MINGGGGAVVLWRFLLTFLDIVTDTNMLDVNISEIGHGWGPAIPAGFEYKFIAEAHKTLRNATPYWLGVSTYLAVNTSFSSPHYITNGPGKCFYYISV